MTALLVIAVGIILYDYMTGRPFFQRCRVARCRLRRKRRPRRNRARYQDYANIDRILDGDDEAKRDLRAMFDERKLALLFHRTLSFGAAVGRCRRARKA